MRGDGPANPDHVSRLFLDLALQRRLEGLPGFDHPPWEVPSPAELRSTNGPTEDKHPIPRDDDCVDPNDDSQPLAHARRSRNSCHKPVVAGIVNLRAAAYDAPRRRVGRALARQRSRGGLLQRSIRRPNR